MVELTPEVRRWVYGIIAATVPLLVTLGTITGDVAQQLLNVAAAMLAIGGSALAIANVPAAPDAAPVAKTASKTAAKK
jgi:hypothetical protein